MGKPAGIKCARKLAARRKTERWADKDFKKANLGTRYKSNPFGGSSHAKGIFFLFVDAFVCKYYQLYICILHKIQIQIL